MNFDVGEVFARKSLILFIYAFSIPLPPVIPLAHGVTIMLTRATYALVCPGLKRGSKRPALEMATI